MEGIQPTYQLGGNDGFGFGGSGIWLFAILALFLFGNGGMWGNRYGQDGRCATVEDLNNSQNFARLENQVQNNGNLVESKMDSLGTAMQTGFNQIGNGICELGYKTQADFAQLNQNIFNAQTAIIADNQKTRDMISQNKIESLQARINQLELAQATGSVVRYPTSTVYSSGCNPFCGCSCGSNI